jgi:hypothetical protein
MRKCLVLGKRFIIFYLLVLEPRMITRVHTVLLINYFAILKVLVFLFRVNRINYRPLTRKVCRRHFHFINRAPGGPLGEADRSPTIALLKHTPR